MMRWMKHEKLYRSKEGSSLVTVIIGVLFLAAIGVIVLTVANKYMVAVNVDHYASDNFYQTEGILEEVKTGLLEYAGDAAEKAYKEIAETYTDTTRVISLRKTFSQKYLTEIISKLKGSAYSWDDAKIGVKQGDCDIRNIQALTKVPDAVTTVKDTNMEFIINYEDSKGYSLTLLNLMFDYTDEADYRSTIRTDICMMVPDYKFQGDSTLEEIKDYIVISDDALKVTMNDNVTGPVFRGKVYTGNKKAGIEIAGESAATFYSPTIISRGSLELLGGSTVNIAGETGAGDLWLQNIRLKSDSDSSLPTRLELNANAYIANDLDIEANNSTVVLSGKYYGYSYNEENKAETATTRSDFSSAILINGLNTTLEAKDLDKLILAGRTFVSRKDDTGNSKVSDIMMGESIAVKSNQLAYLLPDLYINSGNGHNPMGRDEQVSISKQALLDSELGQYLDPSEPYTANYSNAGGYVFYYLKFKDGKSANEYFKKYYNSTDVDEDGEDISHKTELDDKAKAYISSSGDTNMKFSQELFLIAGNVVQNYYASGGSSIESANYYDNDGDPNSGLLADGRKMGQDYVGYQMSLLASGNTTGSMRLGESEPSLVAGKIIDFDKVIGTINKLDDKSNARVYVTSGDYEVDGSIKKGLIIAKGDVEVKSDFTGLILAKGTVKTIGSNLKLNSDMVMLGKLMEFIKKDEELAKLFYGLNGSHVDNPTNLSDCFSYQNWVKNSY